MSFELLTNRLRLRSWRQSDVNEWARLCADAEVMRYFPGVLDIMEATNWIDRQQRTETRHGYCFWVLERRSDDQFLGMTGLHPLTLQRVPDGSVEVGYRLYKAFWNQGYATEAARACATYADQQLQLPELYAVASKINAPSIRVMEKMEMTLRTTFVHPAVPLVSPLQPCVLYRKIFDQRSTSIS